MRKAPVSSPIPHSFLLDELQRIQREKYLSYQVVQFFNALRTGETGAIKEVRNG